MLRANSHRKNAQMGIKGLFTFIKHTGKLVNIKNAHNLKIGVDISYFMYRWGTEPASVAKYLDFIKQFEKNGNKVLFIFDGKPSKYKETEIETRRAVAHKAQEYVTSLSNSLIEEDLTKEQQGIIHKIIKSEKKKAARPTKEQRQWLKRRFYEYKIHMLKSTEEADELLVSLQLNGLIDVIISGDTDLIRLGAQRLWVPIDSNSIYGNNCSSIHTGHEFLEFGLTRVLKTLNLTEPQFQDMCILTGGVPQIAVQRHVDIRKAWSWIRVYGSIEGLIDKHPGYWPCDYSSIREKMAVLKSPGNLDEWVREDERDRLEAWRKGEPPPYTY